MKLHKSVLLFSILLCVSAFFCGAAAQTGTLAGEWELLPAKSADISLYKNLDITVEFSGGHVRLLRRWGRGRSLAEDVSLSLDGTAKKVPFESRVFPSSVFTGLSRPAGNHRIMRAALSPDRKRLTVYESYRIEASQGPADFTAEHCLRLSADELTLIYTITRSSRLSDTPVTYVLKRAGTRHAWFMRLEDDWHLDSGLDRQAFLISLQGLVNRSGPRLYFIYPDTWDFRFTPEVKDFLESTHHYTFRELLHVSQALQTFAPELRHYVVWDKQVRTSLIVAFTIAGLEDAVVVSEAMIPLVEAAGLKPAADLRGQFTGMNDAAIYTRAADDYWERCNHEMIVWMGGHAGSLMKPGVADWGIYNRMFFQDLSTKPADTEEYRLASRLLADMEPMSMVFGWHSYAKDKERDHVTLTSSFGHRVEGLHTLPNMSFSSQVKASPGFTFKNNHTVNSDSVYIPEDKVYIACVQTDCLGLGAWTRPGRGTIPYAWEVTMNWSWLAPAMMEFFYSQATPNDYFIGSLSGPGYMYPKAVPEKYLPKLISAAEDLMKELDLNVFEIMDYSEGATVEGNTELTREIADAYFDGMPDAIGFINGYAPARTFTSRAGRPLVSYDYYLSPERPETAAAADLEELAVINARRPYFLLMHVRQWSDITRVKDILDRLGPEFTLVPLDVFLTLAGSSPTFQERFLGE